MMPLPKLMKIRMWMRMRMMPQLLMMMYVLAIMLETFQLHDCEAHE